MDRTTREIAACEVCMFWEKLRGNYDGSGACRRYAPRPVQVSEEQANDGLMIASWPVTWKEEFCGEFHHKDSKHSAER